MTQLTGTGPQVVAAELFSDSSTQLHKLGELVHTNDGRSFRYAEAGGTALVAGKLQQSSAQVTNHQDLTPSAASVDDKSISVTLGATAAAENLYAEGFALVTTSAGAGTMYPISGHAAIASSGTGDINLFQPIEVALTTSSRIDLVANPYKQVIVNPTTLTSAPIGVGVKAVTADQFGWLQVAGVANVLADGGLTVGLDVVASDNTAGAVEVIADGAAELLPRIGKAVTTVATTEYGAVKLNLL